MRRRQFGLFVAAMMVVIGVAGSVRGQADLEAAEEAAIQAAVALAAPSVVRIETLGGLERVGKQLVASGPTSGVIVGEDGYIVAAAIAFTLRWLATYIDDIAIASSIRSNIESRRWPERIAPPARMLDNLPPVFTLLRGSACSIDVIF